MLSAELSTDPKMVIRFYGNTFFFLLPLLFYKHMLGKKKRNGLPISSQFSITKYISLDVLSVPFLLCLVLIRG